MAERESSSIFQSLRLQATLQQEIAPHQLTLYSDRGGPMKSKSTAQLLTDLGVMRSLSRPHTSNDNPFIESCFRPTKYHPDFPERFETLEKAQAYMAEFMHWYNHDHHHSGIAFLPPSSFIQARQMTPFLKDRLFWTRLSQTILPVSKSLPFTHQHLLKPG